MVIARLMRSAYEVDINPVVRMPVSTTSSSGAGTAAFPPPALSTRDHVASIAGVREAPLLSVEAHDDCGRDLLQMREGDTFWAGRPLPVCFPRISLALAVNLKGTLHDLRHAVGDNLTEATAMHMHPPR
jgi:hypothetical protein